jgi:hypothetical protein
MHRSRKPPENSQHGSNFSSDYAPTDQTTLGEINQFSSPCKYSGTKKMARTKMGIHSGNISGRACKSQLPVALLCFPRSTFATTFEDTILPPFQERKVLN